jgi:hypothetical protein
VLVQTDSHREVLSLSIEEENLASIPFAVLERRNGKRLDRLELSGSKILPDGTQLNVTWQVQGNNELGLPTEQDLDIFVALGVLTFENQFAKTVHFQGREIARILGISSVHGKFYQRLKMAMDRFIPLRFRALSSNDGQEEVKWVNVFQEASFSLDRRSGRCVGSVTWTDKIIQSMDSGFFRMLDASRYRKLDGITAKYLYRFLAYEFENREVVVIDARKLARERLGMLKVPQHFSRLMQTLEPAFEQLRRQRIIANWHVVDRQEWKIALRCHPDYTPGRAALLVVTPLEVMERNREKCRVLLEKAGMSTADAASVVERAAAVFDFYLLERAAQILESLQGEEVAAGVAIRLLDQVWKNSLDDPASVDLLDWCEIALHVCWEKMRAGQTLRNRAGFLVKIIRDAEGREKHIPAATAATLRAAFRRREDAARKRQVEQAELELTYEYEQFREEEANRIMAAMSESIRQLLRQEKLDTLRQSDRVNRMTPDAQKEEAEYLLRQQIIRTQVVSREKWEYRRRAKQTVMPLFSGVGIPV